MKDFRDLVQSTFWSEDHLAKLSRSQASEKDLRIQEGTSCLHTLRSLTVSGLDGLSTKMYPVSSAVTKEGTLEPSSGRWGNWGISTPTGCWTLNGSEHTVFHGQSRSDEGVCSLSDILERSTVPPRYFLSSKACAGILRRAEKRGKALPPLLLQALQQVTTLAEVPSPAK